jgi:hypothetical protein
MGKSLKVQCTRQDLPVRYVELLAQNPLLARIEGECRTVNWSDEEIRTIQLLAACASNASLTQRVKELESRLVIINK